MKSSGKWAGLVLVVLSAAAWGQVPLIKGPREIAPPPPAVLSEVGIDQRLDQQIPLDLSFKDETGRPVRLAEYFGQKPVILTLVYYDCPMLCTEVLNGLTSTLRILKFDAGKEFNVVTVSFDPRETPELAAAKKKTYLARYGRNGAEQGWRFLTGDQANIRALTQAVGFRYAWDQGSQQFAHTTAIMVLTPQGKLTQYYYGVEYSPKDLRFGLIQASRNKIGTVVDQVLLYCYHYDPRTGKYGAVISNVLKISGVATIVILGGFLALMFWGDPKRRVEGRAT